MRLTAFASKYAWRSGTCLPISQPAGSLGDLGQPCRDLFFEAAEVTEAVGCHHGVTEAVNVSTERQRLLDVTTE